MSESSVVDKDIGAITSTTRKNAVKGRGVDWDLSRRNREDKTVQVRKQKRIDRVNIERRKVVFLDACTAMIPLTVRTLHSVHSSSSTRTAARDVRGRTGSMKEGVC
jgi:hypothetical protein